jgi:hypothetical protein
MAQYKPPKSLSSRMTEPRNNDMKAIGISRNDYGRMKSQGMLPKKFKGDMGRFTGSVETRYRQKLMKDPEFSGVEGRRQMKNMVNYASREANSVWNMNSSIQSLGVANRKKQIRTGKPGRFFK